MGARASVRAMSDEVGIELATDGVGRAVPAYRLLDRDHPPSRHVAAPLGNGLVFEVNARHAGLDVLAHRPDDADGIAVAVVRVGDHRHGDRVGDVAGVQVHLRHGGEPGVGQAEEGDRRAVTRHVDGGEAHRFEDLARSARCSSRERRGSCPCRGASQLRRGAHESSYERGANFSSIACHQSKPTLRKMSIGDSTGAVVPVRPRLLQRGQGAPMAGTAAAMHTAERSRS